MTVRKVKESDGPLVKQLRIAALTESPTAFGATIEGELSKEPEEFADFARDRAGSKKDAFFVALEQSQPIGMIGAFFENISGNPFISSMWVHPAHRRNGLGESLFEIASAWLQNNEAREIFAWVTSSNTVAIRFYESLNFVSTNKVAPLPSNPELEERLYVWRVPAT